MKRIYFCLLALILLTSIISLNAFASQLPPRIGIAAESVGSGTYSKAMVFANIIKESSGMDVRLMPNDTTMGVALAMRSEEIACAWYTGSGLFYLAHGLDVFGVPEWGPQPVRSGLLGMNGAGFAVAAASDIYEWIDMKGKRIAISPGTPFVAGANHAFLAYGGLKPEDVVEVVVTGMGGAYDAALEGSVDGQFFPFEGAVAYELEASPRGIRWIQSPPDNKEGWARLQRIMPMYGPFLSRTGAGCSEEKPVWGLGYLVGTFAFKDDNPDIIYAINKAIYEGYDDYKDVTEDLKYWDHEMLLNYENNIYPWHEGTVQFLKDVGEWTLEMEKWQAWKVSQENGRIKAWPKVLEMVKEKNIKVGSEEFLNMWKEYLWQNDLMSIPGSLPQ
ncbi:MAG: TAXI family TRAP transporter solute-binding subunit [Atribacterota bacterium]|nr:TAXI family TRAP transporter solute-binding subunit [Atribacterota bacterium]MDD4896790.1 TAXI family TRAP transporter solute-binding subunit [Atribacterota bacterium]MDD5638201.1 TAXI family TRAP transporter solute-binding subunit [Atribacterota bacterium]